RAFGKLSKVVARRGDSGVALIRAAEKSSRRAPGPWYGLGPAWRSTWTERAASLDSAYPQPDGEHIVTWLPSTDEWEVRTSPPSPQDRLEPGPFGIATPHRFEAVRSSILGRCFPVGSWCCRTTLNSLVLFLVCSDGRMVCTPRLLRRVKAEWYIVAPKSTTLPKVNWLAMGASQMSVIGIQLLSHGLSVRDPSPCTTAAFGQSGSAFAVRTWSTVRHQQTL